ncbi:MAG TPA: ABC transporter ATP-binding protein [Sphingobacteriaceae bacterium]
MMIFVEHVSKSFGRSGAVQEVSLGVAAGETFVLLGSSGAGKTTLLRMINRLVEPDSGSVRIDGTDVRSVRPEALRRQMGYVIQNYGLFPHYTVAENIAIVPRLLRWPAARIRARTEELLFKLQLPAEKFMHLYPDMLSGGQKQRVGLARALAADPPVLLMDEPLGSLDGLTRLGIRTQFAELDELKSKTILMVTHDIAEAMALGDRIGLMDNGRLMQAGRPTDLLFRPENSFVREFFASQRLQSELQSLTLASVWQDLPGAGALSEEMLDSQQSLWQVMESLFRLPGPLTARDEASGSTRTITLSDLQKAVLRNRT